MYSTYPLHVVSYFWLFVMLTCWGLILISWLVNEVDSGYGVTWRRVLLVVGFLLAEAVLGYCCFHERKPYTNAAVTAKFLGYSPESERSGKSTNHYLYGNFQVPEGIVSIQVPPGAPIPPYVMLYRN